MKFPESTAAKNAERRKETYYRDRTARMEFVPFALETYGALSDSSGRFLVECATTHLGSVQDEGPSLACCADGSVRDCRLHYNDR